MCTLKSRILHIIPNNPQQTIVDNSVLKPALNPNSKSDRGHNHPSTALLLCPSDHMLDFIGWEEDDDVRADLLNDLQKQKVILNPEQLPAFLFDWSTWNVVNDRDSVFRGYVLSRLFRAIWTSPSSAVETKSKATRRGNAKIHDLTQVWFALSNGEEWRANVGGFNLKKFYQCICFTLENFNLTQQHKEELFTWFNEQIWDEEVEEVKESDMDPKGEMALALSRWKEADTPSSPRTSPSPETMPPPPSSDTASSGGTGASG
ncbi:hypothetical protein AAF712_010693 [Marasmius tenuissimus]|uniref:Uncharacterized protein n=1 Tax=Marasmius tenuissimus TaxID=585030 RepID=A0ABR2ZN53_9AGAR